MRNRLLDLIAENPSIAGIKDDAGLRQVLKSDCRIVFILYGNVMTIPLIVQKIKEHGKMVFINVDLIDGFSTRDVVVEFLKQHTQADGILSSKAVGEPPLLLASTALCAIQAACDAAREGFAARVGSGAGGKTAKLNGTIENRSKEGPALSAPRTLLTAPATPAAVKAAIGPVPLAEMVAGGPSGKL